jgi:hypothetical protein
MHAEGRGFDQVIEISHRWADSEQQPSYPNDPSRPCLQIHTARKCYSPETSRPHIDIRPSIARQSRPRGADCESDVHRVCPRNLRLHRDTATGYIHFDPSGELAGHGFQADQRLVRPRPGPPVRFRHVCSFLYMSCSSLTFYGNCAREVPKNLRPVIGPEEGVRGRRAEVCRRTGDQPRYFDIR